MPRENRKSTASDAALVALGTQLEAACREEQAVIDGPTAEFEQKQEVTRKIVHRIEHLQARSIAGLKAKVFAFKWCRGEKLFDTIEEQTTDFRLMAGLIADIEAIAARPPIGRH